MKALCKNDSFNSVYGTELPRVTNRYTLHISGKTVKGGLKFRMGLQDGSADKIVMASDLSWIPATYWTGNKNLLLKVVF